MKFKEFEKLSKDEQKKVSFKEIPIGVKLTIVVIAILIIAIFNSKGCRSNSGSDIKIDAYIQSKEYVKSVLNSPSSADFDLNCQTELRNDSTVLVSGYVDSQNSFGAMIRSTYIVKMKWEDSTGTRKWSLIDIDLK